MRNGVRALIAGCSATMIAALLSTASPAPAQCLPGRCGFSESGKQGPFLAKRISNEDLAKNDAAIAGGGSKEGLLAAQSVNCGVYFGTGLSMPESERALEAIVASLSKNWPYRPVGPVRVRIVGSNSFVPQSFADNVIMVPFGVLARARTDGQVAWLLAHEYSHLLLAHFAREARAKGRSRTISQVVGAIDTATALSQARVDTNGGRIRTYEVTDKGAVALGDSLVARTEQLKGLLSLTDALFSRSDEDKADVLGVDLAFAAGYPYADSLDALDIIMNDEGERASMFDAISAKTVEYGQRTGGASLAAAADNTGKAGNIFTNWLKDLGANARVIALKTLKDTYLERHRPTDKRIDGIRKYYQKAYAGVADKAPSRTFLTALRSTREYAEAKVAVDAITLATLKLIENDLAGARAALLPALATRYGSTPLVSNMVARVAERAGDLRGADAAYTRAEHLVVVTPGRPQGAARRPANRKAPVPRGSSAVAAAAPQVLREPYLEQSLDGFRDHVRLLIRMNNTQKAFAVIAEAKARFKDDTAFLPSYVALYFATNQPALAIDALNRCIDAGDPGVEQQCRAGMLKESQQAKVATLSPVDQAKVAATLERTSSKAQSAGWLSQIGGIFKSDD